jgi:hypothetical protein
VSTGDSAGRVLRDADALRDELRAEDAARWRDLPTTREDFARVKREVYRYGFGHGEAAAGTWARFAVAFARPPAHRRAFWFAAGFAAAALLAAVLMALLRLTDGAAWGYWP